MAAARRTAIMLSLIAAPLGALLAHAECTAPHPFSKEQIPVREEKGETHDAYALASWLPYGPPTIYYGAKFHALPPLQKEFVRHHECAHLNIPTFDEVRASCAALKAMRANGLSAQDEEILGRWLQAEGGVGFIYKAGGEDLWQRTLACAGNR